MYSHVAFRHQTILNLSHISLIFFIVVRTTWRVHGVENCGFLSVKDFSLKFLNGSGVCRKICLIFWYIIFKSWWIQHQKLTWNCNMHNFLNGLGFFYMFAIIISCQEVWTFEKYELVHCIKVVWTTQVNINNLCLLVIFFFSFVKIIYYFSFYTLKQREKNVDVLFCCVIRVFIFFWYCLFTKYKTIYWINMISLY